MTGDDKVTAEILEMTLTQTEREYRSVVLRLDVALDAIARVEALHREDYENGPLGICRECYGEDYPCATIRALRGES
jgi:hypothetical protein